LATRLAERARDAGQMDLFFVGTMSPHQRLTIIDQAPAVDIDDFAAIVAQEIAKRALEIAAVGNHPLQFIGRCPEVNTLIAAGRKIGAAQCFHAFDGGSPLDISLEVTPASDADVRFPPPSECSAEVIARVERARPLAEQLHPLLMDGPCIRLLRDAAKAMRLDDEGLRRVIRVGCSIAALAGCEGRIGRIHIAEALAYVRSVTPPEPQPEPEEPEPEAEPEPEPPVGERAFRPHLERIAVDPKRLAWGDKEGDIRAAYSSDTIAGCNSKGSTVRKPFRHAGCEWVNTGGSDSGSESLL
jgi:hypothetical protein